MFDSLSKPLVIVSTLTSICSMLAFGLGQTTLWSWCAMLCLGVSVWLWWRTLGLTGKYVLDVWDKVPMRLQQALPYMGVLVVLLWASWPVALGEMPINQDHNNHYLQTHIFVHDMVYKGQLFGWTDRIGTGLPFGDVYGTFVYSLTSLLYLLTFGVISLESSYCFGVLLAWLIPAWAIIYWTRQLTPYRAAAFLAGVAFVLDAGADREGGWLYAMFHGVWPQMAATGMWLWGLIAMLAFGQKPTLRRGALAVLIVGLSFWFHPMNAVNTLLAAPFLALVHLLKLPVGVDDKHPVRDARMSAIYITVAMMGAGVIGLGWITHLLTASDAMPKFTALWGELDVFAGNLLGAQPFTHHIVLVGALGVLGMLALLSVRTRTARLTLLLFASMVLFGSLELLLALDAGLSDKNPMFMYRRISITMKPLWFGMVGVGFSVVIMGLKSLWEARRARGPVQWVEVLLLLVVMTPLSVAIVEQLPSLLRSPTARLLTEENTGLGDDRTQIQMILEREAKRLEPYMPRRVAFLGKNSQYVLVPIARANFGVLPSKTPPCQAFKDVNGKPFKGLNAMGVSVVISQQPVRLSGVTLIKKLKHYSVYRVDKVQPPVKVIGPGTVDVKRWDDDHKVVSFKGLTAKSKVVLSFAPYKKWQARLDGQVQKISSTRQPGGFLFSTVKGLKGSGELVLRYKHTTLERVSFWLMCAVILLMLVLWKRGRTKLPEGSVRVRVGVGWVYGVGALVVLVALFVMGYMRGQRALHKTWGDKKHRVLRVLHQQQPAKFDYSPYPYCVRPFTRNPRPGCHEADIKPRLSSARPRGHKVPSCMAFTVPDGGSVKMRFDLPSGTTKVVGKLHKVDAKMKITWKDDPKVASSKLSKSIKVDQKSVTLQIQNNNRRTRKVCLELVAIGP